MRVLLSRSGGRMITDFGTSGGVVSKTAAAAATLRRFPGPGVRLDTRIGRVDGVRKFNKTSEAAEHFPASVAIYEVSEVR